jgi:hypothetical protein
MIRPHFLHKSGCGAFMISHPVPSFFPSHVYYFPGRAIFTVCCGSVAVVVLAFWEWVWWPWTSLSVRCRVGPGQLVMPIRWPYDDWPKGWWTVLPEPHGWGCGVVCVSICVAGYSVPCKGWRCGVGVAGEDAVVSEGAFERGSLYGYSCFFIQVGSCWWEYVVVVWHSKEAMRGPSLPDGRWIYGNKGVQ